MIGLCPFHDEKTPSFTVSPTRNIYKCFGCGKGGNAVNFLMEHEGLTYPEALRNLAQRYKIEIEETGRSEEYDELKSARESMQIINDYALAHYQKELFHTDLGKSVGLNYFKERGVLRKTIDQFQLGYASPKGDGLTSTAIAKGYSIELLRQLGLTNKNDRDFFFDRVIFPIHNVTGKVVAFAGRQLSKTKRGPKYINSKESDLYHKSKVLYGLHLAKTAIRKEDVCILVEGYTDVISLVQSGIQHVVASSGTALTIEQIKLIKRYSPNILMLYDGDPAGIKAAIRGVDLVLAQDMNVQLVMLPHGEDPDSYVNKVGTTAFRDFLGSEATDIVHFKARLVREESADDPVKKAALVHDIIETLAHIPDAIKRSIYIKQCADLLAMDEAMLLAETNKVLSKRIRNKRVEKFREVRADQTRGGDAGFPSREGPESGSVVQSVQIGDEFQEKDIVRILIEHGHKTYKKGVEETSVAKHVIAIIEETLPAFDNDKYRKMVELYREQINAEKQITEAYFLHHTDPEIQQIAIDLCASPYDYSENWTTRVSVLRTQPDPDENQVRDSDQALLRFMLRKINKMVEENQKMLMQQQEQNASDDQINLHLGVHQKLLEKRVEIANQLNTVVF